MNDIFFACRDCKVFADAGYRWAYHELVKSGIVSEGKTVDVAAVIDAHGYWNPPDEPDSEWLIAGVLPLVERFFESHRDHNILFGDNQTITGNELGLDWLDVGYLPQYGPRYFAETLKITTWPDVCDFVATSDRKPWWWQEHHDNIHDSARVMFQQLVDRNGSEGG